MSEGRKRSRKSKLEVRDSDEYEVVSEQNDETTPQLQKVSKKVLQLEYPEIPIAYDHDYCQRGSQSFAQPFPAPTILEPSLYRNLYIDSEFEQIYEKENKKRRLKEKRPSLLKKMASTSRKEKKKNKNKSNLIKLCKYDPQMMLTTSRDISSSSLNPADKLLDIEMRNLWGNILYAPHVDDAHETLLQLTFELWQSWYNTGRIIRDCPLFYQCHICYKAWWTLQPFRDHIRTHDMSTLKVSLKENIHECMIIASYVPVEKLIFIDIDEDCWKCGKDLEFHKKSAEAYNCSRCKKTQYTCSAWRSHQTTCLSINISNYNIAKERKCTICGQIIDSLDLIEKHMVLAHSVRSDVLSPVTIKQCLNCEGKYFNYSTHNCIKSPKNSACGYCCRKFATKPLAAAHMNSPFNNHVVCRICGKLVQMKCQEMEHIVMKHSDNYCLAYKCTLCSDQCKMFLDEMSVALHRTNSHQKKADKRRSYYELVLVPTKCLEHEVEESLEIGNSSGRSLMAALQENYDEAESTSGQVLSANVDVIVDEVDIKKERIYDENGEIDYEEMLRNMFSDTSSQISETTEENITKDTELNIKINNEPKSEVKVEPKDDFESVKIKTEPIDIDIEENPLEIVKVKTEPIDDDDEHKEEEDDEIKKETVEDKIKIQTIDTLTVKVEPDINLDDISSGNVVVKCEDMNSDDEISTDVIPLDQLLKFNKDGDMDWVSEELNPDEITLDVLSSSGLYKTKKIYACHKCGYTAQHKHYRLHVSSGCSVSPGINSSHSCTKCGLTFVMFRNYVLHFDKHGYDAMSCPKCGDKFDQQVKLLSHVQKHIKNSFVGLHVLHRGGKETSRANKEVKCQECREAVPHADMFSHWEAHLTLKTKESTSDVPDCQETVKEEQPELTVDCERVTMNNKSLEPATLKMALEHLQSTTSVEKECAVCYRAFSRRYDVKRHIVEHLLMDAHVQKAYHKCFRCQICSEGFQRQEQYKFHMREHGCMPIFKCELCNKTFSDSSNFAKHKKIHGVRVLVCDTCRKKFHSKAALQKHIAEHSIVKQFTCVYCPASFNSKREYKQHKYKHHLKYKCLLCDLRFDTLQLKWNHDWEVHKERKQKADCPICGKSFRKLQDVRKHARSEHRMDLHISTKLNRSKLDML